LSPKGGLWNIQNYCFNKQYFCIYPKPSRNEGQTSSPAPIPSETQENPNLALQISRYEVTQGLYGTSLLEVDLTKSSGSEGQSPSHPAPAQAAAIGSRYMAENPSAHVERDGHDDSYTTAGASHVLENAESISKLDISGRGEQGKAA
jgi:hypothetical protein